MQSMTPLNPAAFPEPKRVAQTCETLAPALFGAVERRAEILEELRAIGEDACANLVERIHRQAAGVGVRLQHQRWYGAVTRPGDTFRSVAADIPSDFAPARRVANMDRVL